MAVTNTRAATAISGSASTTLAYLSAVTAGSTLVAGGADFNTAHASPAYSDSVNGAWTTRAYDHLASASDVEVSLAAFENTGAGTPTVTFNPAGGSADIGAWFIAEVTGATTPTSVDKALTSAPAASNAPGIASGTLAQADEVIVAMMTGDHGGTPTLTLSGDGTYTALVSNNDQSVQMGQAQYKIVAVTTTDTADWSLTPTAAPNPGNPVMALISIKVAGGGGGSVPLFVNSALSGLGSGGPFFPDGLA